VLDLPSRCTLHQLKNWTVVVRIAARGDELLGDLIARYLGVDRLAGAVGFIGETAHERDVEREHGAFAEHDDGRARAHGVADTELVKNVGIGTGDVGHGVMAKHQPLEHRLVNGAADLLLVRADRLETGALDRRRDDLGINGVEIGDAAGGVHLLAEGHQHEAERRQLFGCVHRICSILTRCSLVAAPDGSITKSLVADERPALRHRRQRDGIDRGVRDLLVGAGGPRACGSDQPPLRHLHRAAP